MEEGRKSDKIGVHVLFGFFWLEHEMGSEREIMASAYKYSVLSTSGMEFEILTFKYE